MDFASLQTSELDLPWVTLLRCRNVIEADQIAMRLRARDIPVFIPDEFLSQAIAFNLNTYGYVRLQVPPQNFEQAKDVLNAPPASEPGNAEPQRP